MILIPPRPPDIDRGPARRPCLEKGQRRETESHLFPGWAKAQRVVAPLPFLELGCLSPGVSLPQLGLCKACVTLKPKFKEAHHVANRYFWAVTAAYTVKYS